MLFGLKGLVYYLIEVRLQPTNDYLPSGLWYKTIPGASRLSWRLKELNVFWSWEVFHVDVWEEFLSCSALTFLRTFAILFKP